MISTKRFFCCIVMGLLACQMTSVASATLVSVALTENVDAGYYKSTHADMATFAGAIAPTFSATDDTYFVNNTAAHYNSTHGAGVKFSTAENLIKFDLSAIPSGATIIEARIQLFAAAGNTGAAGLSFGKIATQTWNENDATKAGPNVVSPDLGWGPGANALFNYSVDVPSTSGLTIDNSAAGLGGFTFARFLIKDVKDDVESFISGPNFGWGFKTGNRQPNQSSGGADGVRPVLFVQYEVSAVPEPSSFLLLSLTSLGLMVGKRRRA